MTVDCPKEHVMEMNRRDFLAGTAAVAGAMALNQLGLAAPAPAIDPYALVPLGKTGLHVSRFGIGTGMTGSMRQSNHTRMGQERFTELLRGAYDRGIRLFDMADLYGTHTFFAKAMKGLPREKMFLTSKIWVRSGGIPEKERPDANIVIDRFRKELDTDYIDLVLIHCMTDANWTDQQKKQMDIMDNLKAKGIIKAHGVSIHSIPALKACIDSPWVDSVHTRINPFGLSMDDKDPDKVVPILRKIHDAGKGIVGMKIIGEGKLAKDPDKRHQSVGYALRLGCVDTMVVGFEKLEFIDEFATRVTTHLEAMAMAG
jgi:aryl-alcohol dehydrogenase-like predicted oxidoreductase